MITECPILVGVFDGFSWIRAEGKGSFLNSHSVKAFGEERIAAGERILVIDLETCAGMDSTFMGTLAGLATRLSACHGGVVQVASASIRNHSSLQDLGLDFLMEIDPPEAPWRGEVDRIRRELNLQEIAKPAQVQRAGHVLEAHQILSEANEKNTEKFSAVVQMLENDLAKKQKLAEERKSS